MSTPPGETWKEEKAVEARIGGVLTIRLWEDRTRGETYTPLYDPAVFALITDDYDRTVGENWNIVDSGRRVFEFRPLKAGVHRVVLEKRMGWRFTAEDRRVFIVTVSGDNDRS